MAIKALGESLLSSAKKKAKRGQKLGQLAGLAMVGMSIANSNIRKKAMQRANEWNNSFTPIKKAADGFFSNMGKFTKIHDDVIEKGGDYGWEQGYVERELETLRNNLDLKGQQVNDKELLLLANERAAPLIKNHQAELEFYTPYMNTTSEEFKTQLGLIASKGEKIIKDDNLSKVLGRKYFNSEKGTTTAHKIRLSANNDVTLDVPTEILNSIDLEMLTMLDNIETKTMKLEEFKQLQKEAIKLNTIDGSDKIQAIYDRVILPKTPKKLVLDEGLEKAFSQITAGPKTGVEGYAQLQNSMIREIQVTDKKGSILASPSLLQIKTDLEKTLNNEEIKDPSKFQINDWALLTQAAQQQAQLELLKAERTGQIITPAFKRQLAANAIYDVTKKGLSVKITGGAWFDWKLKQTDYIYNKTTPTLTPVDVEGQEKGQTEVPVPVITMRNRITEYQNNPIGMPKTMILDLKQMAEEFPEYKDEFLLYVPEEDDMTRVDGTKKSDTGFKGPIKNNVDNSTMTEVSIGVMIDGKETLVPAINELTTDDQIETLQNLKIGVDPIPEDIQITAKEAAIKRMEEGKSPFLEEQENKTDSQDVEDKPSLLSPDISDTDMIRKALQEYSKDAVTLNQFRKSQLVKNLENAADRIKENRPVIGLLSTGFNDYIKENYDANSLNKLSKTDKIKAIEEYINILQS